MQKLSLIVVDPEPLPSFVETMRQIGTLVHLIYASLDVGAAVCRMYYEQMSDGERPGPHLREMLVRHQARRHLVKNGLQVTELTERRPRLASEPLISLLIHFDGYAVRVLKATNTMPPGCGLSRRRKNFYNQVPVSFVDDGGKPASSSTNLLVLWDFSPAFGIGRVWLACPEVAGGRSEEVVLAWQELIQNPILHAIEVQSSLETDQDEVAADREIETLLRGESIRESKESLGIRSQQVNTNSPAEVCEEIEEGSDGRQPS